MKQWLQAWRLRREARALARREIPEALWAITLARLPFLARRSASDLAQLRRLSSLFLDQKEFSGAGGLSVSDEMALSIAAQACLPVLHLGLSAYDGFVGIVVHPDEVLAKREYMDDDGVVHAYDELLSGEAMAGGPVMLSWRDVAQAADPLADPELDGAYNVVIHEFAHVLDMADGLADGVPPLASPAEREAWLAVLVPAYQGFCDAVDRGRRTVLDPYGAEGVEEFFAVAAESFFVTPEAMQQAHPALYRLLAKHFRQDPAAAPPQS